MKKFLSFIILFLLFLPFSFGQRFMEKLDRSVVAQKVSNGVYVNWRIPSEEWYNTSYKLYRDGTLIYTTTTSGASNYLDASGTINSKYSVSSVRNGVESAQSAQTSVINKNYIDIPLRDLKKLGKNGYLPNDATAADLDGDGQYEIILKRLKKDWSQECTDYTYFEAYKIDGTFMWAIDVGPNITMDVEINIAAFDFDGDGKAEVFMRSSDGTIFGLDINNQGGVSVGDRDGDGYINYRLAPFNGIGGDGFMNAGPEYLSLIDGMTGKELDWAPFIARGNSNDWGDGYGHRANKFFFGAPYLDGKKPSLFIGRGIYTQTKMQTYDVVNKKLVKRWFWESGSSGTLQQGKYDDSPKSYFGQGYHNYTIADVDDDGKDEINWGSMTVDDDGKPLYSTELGHGDAQHYGDFDPYRKGQEMFACNESKPGTNLRDAKNGKLLYRKVAASDVGRAGAGNISDTYKGAEVWGGGVGLSATDRVELSHFGVAENYCVYWDGDLLQEILDHAFNTSTGTGPGKITKFNSMGNISTLLTAEAYSCNYTKGTPCLQADIFGDWREEAIWWRPDSLALRIYITPYQTNYRIYTLMHDHQYRQAICWQMCGYNQPPHTSFYLGSDFPVPIPAKSTNGKLVLKGSSASWDTSNANFIDGDNGVGVISGNAPPVAFTNGKCVLFDESSANKNINLNENLQPELLMISGNDNYTLSGNGSLSGTMILDKTGEGTLTINGNHSYTGKTDIWEGILVYNGKLNNSPVTVRRHAGFGGKTFIGNNLSTEYNASVYPGGINKADTMKIAGNLTLANGAKLVFDLSDNPTIADKQAKRSDKTNDFLQIDGTLNIATGSIIAINEIADSISEGKYLLLKAQSLTGSVAGVKTQGTGGRSVSLNYDVDTKELFLIVVGTRSASAVVWTGKTSNVWNVAKTANWSIDGYDDIFVNNDSVNFDDTALNRSISLSDSVFVSAISVNNSASRTYTISGSGSINGPASLVKNGAGTLNLNTRNSFTGKVIVNEGTLSMQYAPSSISNGGIGKNITDPTYLVLRDSAILQITTANEQTNRGLTVEGQAGGLLNVPANIYWDGTITGSKLTKTGSATLYLGSNNPNLNETVLRQGTLRLNSNESVAYGPGKKITILGGTLDTKNDINAYLTSNHNFEIPEGSTANINAAARCEYNGSMTGGGTVNWRTDYIRAFMNGNWSAFTGKLNLIKNTANSSYDDIFIVNSSYGYPNATVDIATGVVMCYKNGTSNNGTSTIRIGLLTGAGSFYNAGLEVGSNNVSGSFSGVISGQTSVKKVGSALWILSGANTYTGSTIVSSGTLNLTGSISTGTVTVQNNAIMYHNGTNAGNITIQQGGTLFLGGICSGIVANSGVLRGSGKINSSLSLTSTSVTSPGNNSVGTITVGGNVVMSGDATLDMQLSGTSAADKLAITGTMNCSGILNVSILSGAPVAGSEYQLFSALTINGSFNTINLPEIDKSLEWDLTDLYTSGIIRAKLKTGVVTPNLRLGLKQNPTSGVFHIYTDASLNDAIIMVSDMHGRLVYESKQNMSETYTEINLEKMPSGIYLLRLHSNEGNTDVLKLIKN